MNGETLVSLRGVGKAYPRITRPRDRLQAFANLLRRRDPESVTVLEGIDLDVRRGQSVGIIGENGAGKSTLLKLVAGVLTPTRGEIAVNGRIGALLELGAGFHPEYSGRENLKMAGALLGLSRRELKARMDEIIEFADIGDYLDEPIGHYSSGMVVRLGFALIAAVRPDLLITDEVLAVGDESFQKKCIRWMQDYLEGGGTLLLVSHGMYHVQKLCQRACWIHHGRMEMTGDVFDVTQAYLAYHERKAAPAERPVDPAAGEYRIRHLEIAGDRELAGGDSLTVRGRLFSPDGRPPAVLVGVLRADGTPVYGAISEADGFAPAAGADGDFAFEIEFPGLPLLPGSYEARAHAMDPEGLRLFDQVSREFRVRGETREMGFCRLHHRWRRPE